MNEVFRNILEELQRLNRGIIAIDGRCGSGKTGLGNYLKENLDCNLIHMDDFYLPLSAREENWRDQPGKNIDFPRLMASVLEPGAQGKEICYRPYDCRRGEYGKEILLSPGRLTILEGSYSQMPMLRPYYSRMYFLTCDPEVQKSRLQHREGERFLGFEQLWIPLEEAYIQKYPPVGTIIDTETLFST